MHVTLPAKICRCQRLDCTSTQRMRCTRSASRRFWMTGRMPTRGAAHAQALGLGVDVVMRCLLPLPQAMALCCCTPVCIAPWSLPPGRQGWARVSAAHAWVARLQLLLEPSTESGVRSRYAACMQNQNVHAHAMHSGATLVPREHQHSTSGHVKAHLLPARPAPPSTGALRPLSHRARE